MLSQYQLEVIYRYMCAALYTSGVTFCQAAAPQLTAALLIWIGLGLIPLAYDVSRQA
jgi:hypothetical protein